MLLQATHQAFLVFSLPLTRRGWIYTFSPGTAGSPASSDVVLPDLVMLDADLGTSEMP